MTRILATTVALAFLVAGVALAADAPAEPIVFKSEKQGDMTFKHATHKDQKCTTCHTTDAGGKIGIDPKKGHALCLACHKEKAKGE